MAALTMEPREHGVVAEAGGALLGGLIGIVAAGPLGGAAGGLIGATAAPVFERWVARMLPEFHRRGEVIAEAAACTSGLDNQAVVERVLDLHDAQPLVVRVLDAATRTNADEVLRLLGGVLGEAASNRAAKIDEDLMLVDGITDLSPGHLRVLEVLDHPVGAANEQEFIRTPTDVASVLTGSMTVVGVAAAIGGLLARGLVDTHASWGGPPAYKITNFGRSLLAAARRAAVGAEIRPAGSGVRQADGPDP